MIIDGWTFTLIYILGLEDAYYKSLTTLLMVKHTWHIISLSLSLSLSLSRARELSLSLALARARELSSIQSTEFMC